ncbi:uncharacterized protein CBP isoform X4 [Cherax quadricarinatus]|uniref:uncharacterized protein CBP isoform X4 n=1 Tax=Cherax quadricarinatus TaxID=27406 RepID=UPI00387E2B94
MSLSRCVTSALRTRHALQRLVYPMAVLTREFVKLQVGGDDGHVDLCLPVAKSEVWTVREYSKRASARSHAKSDSSSDSDSDRGSGSGKRGMTHVWEEEWGASGDPYVFIGQEQFLMQMEHVVNTKDLRKKVASPLVYFFKAVDTDGSGEISIEEFEVFYTCLGLTEEDAAQSFAAIDKNGDGKLSRKEFVKLGREFFLSEDETQPSKLFWGPLSD